MGYGKWVMLVTEREYGDRIGFSEERDKLSFRHVDFEVLVNYPSRDAYLAFRNLGLEVRRKV